jgi:hypothetical protein
VKDVCIEKATHACKVVREANAPNAGEELFNETVYSSQLQVSEDLVVLMSAYQLAAAGNAKLQILSIYVHRYPTETLMKIHEPYGRITKWQIKKARVHAKLNGPGNESGENQTKQYSSRFSQILLLTLQIGKDVAFGTRMPNVIHNATRSTLIAQYIQYC